MSACALEISHLTKIYPLRKGQSVKALDDVSLRIEPGEIFGLLGPNGAGKTTLINCALSIVRMTSGRIRVFGCDAVKDYVRARSRVGFVYQEPALDKLISVWRTLMFHRGLYGRPPNPAHVEKLLRQLDLWKDRNKRVDQLSGGTKRRLALAQALVHEPDMVFLDEPTAGVDIDIRDRTWQMIRDINAAGTTILLTTHYIEEAEMMCHRVGIINNGQFLRVATPRQLIREMGQRSIHLYVRQPLTAEQLQDFPYVYRLHTIQDAHAVSYEVFFDQGTKALRDCIHWFEKRRIPIDDIEVRAPNLEDVFRMMAWGGVQKEAAL